MEKQIHFNMNKMQGMDADIETSLFEYNLAWIKSECDTEYRFWYRYFIHTDDDTANRFNWCDFKADLDVYKEFEWVDFESIYSFVGIDKKDWGSMELPTKISDLMGYYGQEEMFGSCHHYGFKYLAGINRFVSINE